MPITFQYLAVAERMVRSISISVAGSRSSDPSPPIRIPAGIDPRSLVRMLVLCTTEPVTMGCPLTLDTPFDRLTFELGLVGRASRGEAPSGTSIP